MTNKVRWAELFPDEFLERQRNQSVVYLPMGLCEPHGHIAVLGLDTLKADYLCDEAARRFGGIVAPTQGYQIHESGYHAPWLADVVGNVRPYLTAMPPHVMLHFFLYQLRAFHNANFRTAIVISGHAGGNEHDFRLAAHHFAQVSDMQVRVFADPELVQGQFTGDHAGAYEISQLLHVNPTSIRLDQHERMHDPDSLGRFAQGDDALKASAVQGKAIIEASLTTLQKVVNDCAAAPASASRAYLSYETIESVWEQLKAEVPNWRTTQLNAGQQAAPASSMWKVYERNDLLKSSPAGT